MALHLIDLLVDLEINKNGRNVYIDYTRNPSWKGEEIFSIDRLDTEVVNYLANSDAMQERPVERLSALNAPAIALYKDHGIDLEREALQIAVCAQHNNGGLKANIWWESDLKHLFPVGEVNGSHGVNRPGGSALNAGQVGGYRAAMFITKQYNYSPPFNSSFISEVKRTVVDNLNLATTWMESGSNDNTRKYLSEIQKRMSATAGIIRTLENVEEASSEAAILMKKCCRQTGADSVKDSYRYIPVV